MIYTLPFLLYSAYTDVVNGKIKNYITFPMMILGLILNTYMDGLKGFQLSISGVISAIALSLIVFIIIRNLGMGDIKLLMGIGSFVGAVNLFSIYLLSLVLFLIVQAVVDKRFFSRLKETGWHIKIYTQTFEPIAFSKDDKPKAFAPYILMGTILMLIVQTVIS